MCTIVWTRCSHESKKPLHWTLLFSKPGSFFLHLELEFLHHLHYHSVVGLLDTTATSGGLQHMHYSRVF
jgi:hypothetical protein